MDETDIAAGREPAAEADPVVAEAAAPPMTAVEVEAEAVATAAEAAPAIEAVIVESQASAAARTWFERHIPGSPVSRYTEAWNHLQAVFPELLAVLRTL